MIGRTTIINSIDFIARAVVLSDIVLEKVKDLAFCVGKNTDLPILSNLNLTIANGQLTLIASDLINTANARIEAVTDGSASVCVSFDLLLRHLTTLESEQIAINVDNSLQKITVFTSQAEYELPVESSENWPKLQVFEHSYTFDVKLGELASKFNEVMPFVSHEVFRPSLNGINLRFRGNHIAVSAFDGNAFCIRNIHSDSAPTPLDDDLTITLSSKIARAFSSFTKGDSLELVTIRLNDATLSFSELPNGISIVTQLVDATFPDLQKLIPTDNSNQLVIDRTKLLAALNRSLPFVDNDLKNIRVKLTSPEKINLRAEDSSNSKHAWENLTAEYQGNEIEFGVSITYLKNGTNIWKSEKMILLSSVPNKPIVLKSPEADENDVVVISTTVLRSTL